MKKKIFGGIAVVVIAVAVAFNVNLVNKKSAKVTNFMLTNVEMLAHAEPGEFTVTCSKGSNGYCFTDGFWLCMEGEFVCYSCEYTGSPNDYCSCPC